MAEYISVIDLGSSSVRFMLTKNGKVLQKKSNVCRLAENKTENYLDKESMLRTAKAIKGFVDEAKTYGGEIYIFATAAVRNSANGKEFSLLVEDLTGIKVEILSGEEEAEIGLLGALGGKDGAIIDIGGASSEIIVASNGKIIYEKSLPLGGVMLKNLSGSNIDKARQIAKESMAFYGEIPNANFVGIGGTATCITALALGLKTYDRNLVHGYTLEIERLQEVEKYLRENTAEEVAQNSCVNLKRAEILPYGAQILTEIFSLLNIKSITVSESDNLEGFLLKKGGLGYEKG